MTTIVKPLPHDLAVVAALETLTVMVGTPPVSTAVPVDFARAPKDALTNLKAGGPDYIIVWPISSGRDGSLGDPWSDGTFTYQIDCVGRLPEGVRWLIGEIDEALASVAITGRVVTQIVPVTDGRVLGDFDTTPHIYTAQPERQILTVPA